MNKNFLHHLLIFLLALTGVGLLVLAVFYYQTQTNIATNVRAIIAGLFFLDAIFYFVVAWGVCRKIKWLYWCGIALVAVNAVAIIFDDIGFYDIIASLINIPLLIMLISDRKQLNPSTR